MQTTKGRVCFFRSARARFLSSRLLLFLFGLVGLCVARNFIAKKKMCTAAREQDCDIVAAAVCKHNAHEINFNNFSLLKALGSMCN